MATRSRRRRRRRCRRCVVVVDVVAVFLRTSRLAMATRSRGSGQARAHVSKVRPYRGEPCLHDAK